MSKRRLSLQQTKRIQEKAQRQQPTASHRVEEGLIITRSKQHAWVENALGHQIVCAIRPSITTLVAGDRVTWQQETATQGVVLSCLPRQSVLGRPDKEGNIRPVAANITQLILVIAPQPAVSWSLVDSYLIVADYLRLNLSILLNKTDIPCQPMQQALEQIYAPLGYPLLYTGLDNPQSYQQLQKSLAHETNVFIGQSGVGKSSLISKLMPHSVPTTAPLSDKTQLGQHTTSHSYLYHLPSGGELIDSPGIREFSLWHMPLRSIAEGFREFKPLLSQCKFRNCTHERGPRCAIVSATEKGVIAQQRYESYVKIMMQYAKPIK